MSRGKRITEAEFMFAKIAIEQGETATDVAKKLGRNAGYIRDIVKKYPTYTSYIKAVSKRTIRKTEPVLSEVEVKKVARTPLFGSHFVGKRIIYKPLDAREGKEYKAIHDLMPLQRMSLKRKAAQWLAIIDDIESQEAYGRN